MQQNNNKYSVPLILLSFEHISATLRLQHDYPATRNTQT